MSLITFSDKPKYAWWVRFMLRSQTKKLGNPLEPVLLWGRIPRIFAGFLWLLQAFKRQGSPFSKSLQAIVRVRVSQLLHCPFCIDMNLSEAYAAELSQKKMTALPDYNDSQLYDSHEKLVLNYTKSVVRSDKAGCIQYLQELKKTFSNDALIELTALIAHQSMSALFNSALGVAPHGFCHIPVPSQAESEKTTV